MRISASDISFDTQTNSQTYTHIREQLTEGYVLTGSNFSKNNLIAGTHTEQTRTETTNQITETPTYSDLRQDAARENVGKYTLDQLLTNITGRDSTSLFELTPEDKMKIELLKKIYEHLTGKTFHSGVLDLSNTSTNSGNIENPSSESSSTPSAISLATEVGAVEYGLDYRYTETTEHQEQLQFQAKGQVRTADGKVIDLDLQLNLSRSASESESLHIRMGAALKDPLVINFSGQAAELTANKISFDIDMDGDQELIHQLSEQSGYIALDHNGNGQIDDGSELFGASSGNGFKELAAYDDDHNGFIDENDDAWDKLRIWVQHDDGSSSLFTLAEKDVGALYLGYTDTDWDLNAGPNSDEIAGKVRATGLFLTESGDTGTLQQVDLVI
ncbi:hypothetical protein [Neptuniibacter sp. 1_MG-2023]|uniref:hypothetical protein n=1 Tax=Neptuniibacter sp. 1_MG-2023 TaxID=3062662 RepID=UPI0026E24FCA|nr:hypothetical protein [Neptuniibacter sp. 1_MG-2023]MDO6593352.1 hypothetical protein [Neptuniibacter sp. 1_MG-2023]